MLNFYYFISRLYSALRPLPGWYNKIYSPSRYLLRRLAQVILPCYFSRSVLPHGRHHDLGQRVIVSLTSFPKRIGYVWMTIHSLMRQTVQPDKIILWLSKEQFHSVDDLPENLRALQGEMFEIRFVEHDYKSHKKYLYAFGEFADDCVILADDDIIYNYNLIEKLIEAHKVYPDRVICNYGQVIKYDDGMITPDSTWQGTGAIDSDDQNFFFGTGGGTLLVPNLLYKDVSDIALACQLTPYADDVWLNAMARLAGLRTYFLNLGPFLPTSIEEDEALYSHNITQNDVQINRVIDYYVNSICVNPFGKR